MKNETHANESGWRLGILVSWGSFVLLASSLSQSGCVSKPGARHAVAPIVLSQENLEYQRLYVTRCDNCHDEMPDPAEPYCFSEVAAEDHLAIWEYEMAMFKGDADYSAAGKALFEATCVGCHDLPDPSVPGCFSGASADDVIPLHVYMDDSRRGKELYEEDCRSCHADLDPSSHDIEYWSTHMCNADEHLSTQAEQQVLLYLAAHAKRASFG